jgi:putative phage-type endonuclease
LTEINDQQRSAEWFASRRNKLTASDFGAIMGVDPNRTREDVLRAKVREHHGAEREWNGNIATQWGETHEPEAREAFEVYTGLKVTRASFVISDNFPWVGASPDGYVGDDANFEAKCPFGLRNDTYPVAFKTIKEQPHYMFQVQGQMFVTGRIKTYFWQWTPNDRALTEIEYDPDIVQELMAGLEAFRVDLVKAIMEPEDYLESPRKMVDTIRARQMVAEMDDLTEAIEKATERKKELLDEIVQAAGSKNAIFGGRKLTKVEKSGAISYASAIKVLAPNANLEPWRGKPSSYWLFK